MPSIVSPSVPAHPQQGLNDRVASLLERVDYRLASTPEDREAIFQLRYRAYLDEGAIPANNAGTFCDSYDDTANVWTFGVHIEGVLAASLRLHVATPADTELPALAVFGDVLRPALEAGRIIIDPTRFVADLAASRRFPGLCYVTTRLAWLACEYFHADLLLATVRQEHQAFYRRVFGHRPICEPRTYPSLTKPISMMALDYGPGKERVLQRHPFFRSSHFERRMLFAPLTVRLRHAA